MPGRGPETLVALERWSAKDKAMEAELTLGSDAAPAGRLRPREKWTLKAALLDPDSGPYAGLRLATCESGINLLPAPDGRHRTTGPATVSS